MVVVVVAEMGEVHKAREESFVGALKESFKEMPQKCRVYFRMVLFSHLWNSPAGILRLSDPLQKITEITEIIRPD